MAWLVAVLLVLGSVGVLLGSRVLGSFGTRVLGGVMFAGGIAVVLTYFQTYWLPSTWTTPMLATSAVVSLLGLTAVLSGGWHGFTLGGLSGTCGLLALGFTAAQNVNLPGVGSYERPGARLPCRRGGPGRDGARQGRVVAAVRVRRRSRGRGGDGDLRLRQLPGVRRVTREGHCCHWHGRRRSFLSGAGRLPRRAPVGEAGRSPWVAAAGSFRCAAAARAGCRHGLGVTLRHHPYPPPRRTRRRKLGYPLRPRPRRSRSGRAPPWPGRAGGADWRSRQQSSASSPVSSSWSGSCWLCCARSARDLAERAVECIPPA
jgi:hypothetical protein